MSERLAVRPRRIGYGFQASATGTRSRSRPIVVSRSFRRHKPFSGLTSRTAPETPIKGADLSVKVKGQSTQPKFCTGTFLPARAYCSSSALRGCPLAVLLSLGFAVTSSLRLAAAGCTAGGDEDRGC